MKATKVGDFAPPFTAESHNGQTVSLNEFQNKCAVVLFFYPLDNSPICTAEACAFRDSYEQFADAGAVVIGVSGDSPRRHRNFAARNSLSFLLLSDEDSRIRNAFGVPRTLGILPGRVTYVIDKSGIVRHIFAAQFAASQHVSEALKAVHRLRTEDSTSGAGSAEAL